MLRLYRNKKRKQNIHNMFESAANSFIIIESLFLKCLFNLTERLRFY